MSKGTVAIIGKPNVGKSTFFNYLVGQRLSIVEDTPGVTRDRVYGETNWRGKDFTIIDTGGIEEKANDEKFKVGLKNLAYQPSGGNKSLRYFFSTLCDYYRWHKEGEHGNPCANNEHIINYDNVTIEHIDSQHAQDGNTLPKESLNKLKNLTILSRDDNGNRVGNKPFAEKKETYAKSCYKINGDLAKYDAWQPDEAPEWENYLVDFGCKIFVVK